MADLPVGKVSNDLGDELDDLPARKPVRICVHVIIMRR